MSKVNTLFTYFNKTPKAEKTQSRIEKTDGCLTPKDNSNITPKDASSKSKNAQKDEQSNIKVHIGEVVWSKLEGYPWWPSLVSAHPKSHSHIKVEKKRQVQVHVQFFDDPPTRGWVKEKFVKPYGGSEAKESQRGGVFHSRDPKWVKACEHADKAMALEPEKRIEELIVVLESSEDDEEDEDDDEEDMEIDADLMKEFDNDMSEDEMDNSGSSTKENTKENLKTPVKSETKSPKRSRPSRSSAKPQSKRRRIMVASDSDVESEDEYKVTKKDVESSESDVSSGVDEDEDSEGETESEPPTPVKDAKRKRVETPARKPATNKQQPRLTFTTPTAPTTASPKFFTPSIGEKTKSKLASFSAADTVSSPAVDSEEQNFVHLTFEFLKPGNLRDAEKNPTSSLDYDPRTIFVPDSHFASQTPAMRQWWKLKAQYFDTVLFFKMGKFYELFHMDASVGVKELGLVYMKGNYAHAGFPEIAFGRYADTLIQKGYKVVRIEQTETPDMMQERVGSMGRSATKFDKVVRREVCSVQTRGTKRYSFIDGDSSDSVNAYLLAVCEKSDVDSGSCYGVCFVDTSIGKFYLGQFEDDRHCSRLRTLISHYPPAQLLLERGRLSDRTQTLLANTLPAVLRELLRPGSEYLEAGTTLKTLGEEDYFTDDTHEEAGIQWPGALKSMISQNDSLGMTPAEDSELALHALGGTLWYLKESFMDQELVSLKNFERYSPLDMEPKSGSPVAVGRSETPAFITNRQRMVLDGVTLANLDILVNGCGGSEGTLLQRLDTCSTPFGKRLLKQWICAPLCNPAAVDDRLDAVEDLINIPDITAEATELLKQLPDLERLLSKIHTLGSASRSKNHPDSRAVFFEDLKYSKKKIEDFLSTLDGFRTAADIVQKFKKVTSDFKSRLLKQTVTVAIDDKKGRFPDLVDQLKFFEAAFDHAKAKSDGVIRPCKGVDPDYDQAIRDIKSTVTSLDDYLDKQKKKFGCRSITYWGTGRNRYQMEIPESTARQVTNEYELTSSKKGTKRYRTPHIDDLLAEMTEAEERRDVALRDSMRRIFFSFDKHYQEWDLAVQCLSVLDVLITLSNYSQHGDGAMTRPELVTPSSDLQPFLEIQCGRHPCIGRTFSGGDYIPNDTVISTKQAGDSDDDHANSCVVLVTGPNMGGKSTLMRQAGVIAILAQLGCYVPAELCRMTPVDRVFTRLGASDRIMAGESTFFVELSETSSILQHATRHSLVLLDELGRGTATYDGTAIACAVVNDLTQRLQCRSLFSTHYHSLVGEFATDPHVRLGHMACMVENEDADDPSQETITFLYKFIGGACPKSYGFNAARLADLPDSVISKAQAKAREFEAVTNRLQHFRDFCITRHDMVKLRSLQESITL